MNQCTRPVEGDRSDDLELPEPESRLRCIDVTEVATAELDAYVRDRVDADRVSLEHRGARTFLVVEE